MSPPVPNLQLNQLLIFWHLCFICFSTPHIHSQLQLSSFILLGNFYTLKHTIFHCTIVANEHSHIIYTPTTIQSIFILPEISFVSPLTRPRFRDKTLIWFFNLWLFLPALELHINETILLWLCLLLFSILFVRLIHFAERFLLDYHCTVSHCENAASYSGRTIIRWYLTIWTSGDGQWVASVFCLLASLQLCPILCNPILWTWGSPGKNTGVGCHCLLQGIFPTQGSNPHLSHLLNWQVGSLPLTPPGKPAFDYRLKKKLLRTASNNCFVGVCVFFISLRYIPRNEVAKSKYSSILIVWYCQAIFQNGCTILNSHIYPTTYNNIWEFQLVHILINILLYKSFKF